MTEPLIVDTDQLNSASTILGKAAGTIPVELPKLSVPGTDPLSLAVAKGAAQVEAPMAALPGIQTNATTTAENIGLAGQKYAETDRTQAEKAAKQTFRTDDDEGWEKKRKYGKAYSKEAGRSATHADGKPPIKTAGDVVKQWGSERAPEQLSSWEGKSGKYQIAAGQGDWSVKGPIGQREAYVTQTTDGFKGRAGINFDLAKAEGTYSTPGGFATAAGSASALGYKAEAEAVLTDHGIYGGTEAFIGAKAEGHATFDWGPVKWTVLGAGEAGAGAGAHGVAGMQDGVIEFGGDASLAFGLGGKLGSHLEIDTRAIVGGVKHAADWLEGLVQGAS